MAALSTPDPKADSRGVKPADRLRLLRALGKQSFPAWAALDANGEGDGKARLVVAERARRRELDDGDIADWIRDARVLEALDHPNVARVRDVVIRSDEVLVVTEFVDGVRWREVAATPATPLETALRVFVDVLSGLNALHNLRDARRQPLNLVHGALTPESVVVGLDGVARLLGAARPRAAAARAGEASAYLAPEVLLEDDSADARADTYSVGVMLWEALSGQPFLPDLQPSAIVTHLLSGRSPPVTIPASAPWAAPLAHVVKRALSPDPTKRFASASAMAAELRRIASARLPTGAAVASVIRTTFGEKILARRRDLEAGVVRAPAVASKVESIAAALAGTSVEDEELSVDVFEATDEPSQTAPTVPPPGAPPDRPVAASEPPAREPLRVATDPARIAHDAEASAVRVIPIPLPPPVPSLPPETTTTVPFAVPAPVVATPLASATPLLVAPVPRSGLASRFAIAGVAVVALAAASWWLAVRGSAPSSAAATSATEVHALPPAAITPPAAPPVAPAATMEEPEAPNAAPPENESAPSSGAAPSNTAPSVRPSRATGPTLPSTPRFNAQPAAPRPRPAAVRRGYDPQGI